MGWINLEEPRPYLIHFFNPQHPTYSGYKYNTIISYHRYSLLSSLLLQVEHFLCNEATILLCHHLPNTYRIVPRRISEYKHRYLKDYFYC